MSPSIQNAEVRGITQLDRQQVNRLIHQLQNEGQGKIERIAPAGPAIGTLEDRKLACQEWELCCSASLLGTWVVATLDTGCCKCVRQPRALAFYLVPNF